MNRLPGILRQHIAALRGLLLFTVLCGIVYPVVMFGAAQAAFHHQANGSPVSFNGRVVGSSLLCQEFVTAKGAPLPQYFQPRPSNATSGDSNDYGCDPGFSAASNLGPNNPDLVTAIRQRQQQIAAFDHVKVSAIPAGRGHRVRVRPRPVHLSGVRLSAGRPGGQRPAHPGRYRAGAGRQPRPGAHAGFPGRAAGQRAGPQHRPGPALPGARVTVPGRAEAGLAISARPAPEPLSRPGRRDKAALPVRVLASGRAYGPR